MTFVPMKLTHAAQQMDFILILSLVTFVRRSLPNKFTLKTIHINYPPDYTKATYHRRQRRRRRHHHRHRVFP